MANNLPSPRDKTARRPERGDATRRKLLNAAVDVFGRLGFDGTSTRAVADAAGVNLQAIRYYFDSKEGLYLAAAEHVAALIRTHNAEMASRVRARLVKADMNSVALKVSEARSILTDIMQTLATLYVSRESELWARFMMREQMEPTGAFKRMYEGVMKPGTEIGARLVGIILNEPPESEHVRLRTLSLIGSVLMYRMARATSMAQLGWKSVGPREIEAIRNLAAELVASIAPSSEARSTRRRPSVVRRSRLTSI